jgi:glutathione S-transferase
VGQFYPQDPAQRAMVNSAMFYLTGTLYPLVARATYPTLGFPQYAGEVGSSEGDDALKAQAEKDAAAAIEQPLEAYRTFFLDGRRFIGGDLPSIADIRLAATLEFLHAIDYPFPCLGNGIHERDRGVPRRRLLRAGQGRPRLRGVDEVPGRVNHKTA